MQLVFSTGPACNCNNFLNIASGHHVWMPAVFVIWTYSGMSCNPYGFDLDVHTLDGFVLAFDVVVPIANVE